MLAMGSEDMAAPPGKRINKTASQGLREQEVTRIGLGILSSLSDLMSVHGLLAESSRATLVVKKAKPCCPPAAATAVRNVTSARALDDAPSCLARRESLAAGVLPLSGEC